MTIENIFNDQFPGRNDAGSGGDRPHNLQITSQMHQNEPLNAVLINAYWNNNKESDFKVLWVEIIKHLELGLSISYKIIFAPSEYWDHLAYSRSLIRVFPVHLNTLWILGYPRSALQRPWTDCADAQANLRLPWAHMLSVPNHLKLTEERAEIEFEDRLTDMQY